MMGKQSEQIQMVILDIEIVSRFFRKNRLCQ